MGPLIVMTIQIHYQKYFQCQTNLIFFQNNTLSVTHEPCLEEGI